MNYCPNCGAPVSGSPAFCSACGAQLGASPVAHIAPTVPPKAGGTGFFIAAVVFVSLTAILCIAYYPFREGGGSLVGYFGDAALSLWWAIGLGFAFAARSRGQVHAVRVSLGVLGVAVVVGAVLTASNTPPKGAPTPISSTTEDGGPPFRLNIPSGSGGYSVPDTEDALPDTFWGAIVTSIPDTDPDASSKADQIKARLEATVGTAYTAYSVEYSSLTPGYIVVFAGPFDTGAEAEAEAASLRAAGFAGAYPRDFAK